MRNTLEGYAIYQFRDLLISWHHQKIIAALEAVERGEIKRLIITAPPRHSKSLLTSTYFPAWCMGRDSTRQVICATYGQKLSLTFGRKVKAQLASNLFGAMFPDCILEQDSRASNMLTTTKGGVYTATSIGGALTGLGADILIIDDPLKDRQEANSEQKIEVLHDWYDSTAHTRLQPNGAIVIMATRWAENDLTGYVLEKKSTEWVQIHLPAIDDDGAALWPDYWPLESLEEIKTAIGSYEFESLYQGNPTMRTGGIFKVDKINYYDLLPLDGDGRPKIKRLIQSLDSANKIKKINDYSVLGTLARCDDGVYFIDGFRERLEYPELKTMAKNHYEQTYYGKSANIMLVEDKASGTQFIQEYKREGMNVIPVNPDADKVTRSGALSGCIEAGNFYLPRNHPMTRIIVEELRMFPFGKHDDTVDMLTMAYDRLNMTQQPRRIKNPLMR